MAKIDFSLIQGYEAMSAEDKLKAIEALEIPDASEMVKLQQDAKRQKELIDRYTGEISSLKKAQSAGLSAAEQKSREQEETLKDLQEKYQELLKSSTISSYTNKYLALGYDEALATSTAKALVDGDMDTVFSNSEKFKANLEKQFKAEAVKSTGRPDGKGAPPKPMTKDEIMKIKDSSDRQKAIAEHLDLFE